MHIAGQGGPLNKTAADAVNTVIKNLRMSIAISAPTTTGEGPNIVFNAGSLIFTWQQSEQAMMSVVLGGATLRLASSEGLAFQTPPLPPFPSAVAPPAPLVPGEPARFALPAGGVADVPLPVDGGTSQVTADPPAEALLAAPASRPLSLFGGLPIAAVLLGLAGVALLAAGLRRLPDSLLAAPAGSCPAEGGL